MNNGFSSKGPAPVINVGDPLAQSDNRVLVPEVATPPVRPPSDVVWSLAGETMGTTWSVRAVPPLGADQDDLTRAVQEELDVVSLVFSHWDPRAEVARFNAVEPGAWSLSDELWTVLNAALDIADDTNGAVDPTLGALIDLWGFGPSGPRAGLPTDIEIDAALDLSGWQDFRLSRQHQAAVQRGGARLDFSAMAKGHAADRVSERLIREGATSHLIEIGGEMKGVGVQPDAQPWWAEIPQPPGLETPPTVVALVDLAMSTTDDARGLEADGRRHGHILDGRSGKPVDNGLAQVTVLHASGLRADALATALMVMGPFEGPEFASIIGLAAYFVERTPRGVVEHMSPAFAKMMGVAVPD